MKVQENSTWLQDLPKQKNYPELKENISVDIAIIGGGLTGITAAYYLTKAGKKVAVLEKKDVTNTVTAYTTAFLTHEIDTPLTELETLFGKKNAQLIWQSHADAIDEIEKIVKEENIDCEFMRCNEYMYALGDNEYTGLKNEQKRAKTQGFSLKLEKPDELPFENNGSLLIPNQAKFHPIKYLLGLRDAAMRHGLLYYENTEAQKIEGDETVTITTPHATVTAKHVIIATYNPLHHHTTLFGKKGMYMSYVLEAEVEKGFLEGGLYLDQDNPYHYFRIDSTGKKDRLIIGGEDHRQEIPISAKKNYTVLEEYLESIIPSEKWKLVRRWNGPILEPSDGLAYIGRFESHDNRYIAVAFSGNGMTYATVAGFLLTDLIEKRKNAYEDIYDPKRVPTLKQLFEKGRDYTEELFGGAVKNIVA